MERNDEAPQTRFQATPPPTSAAAAPPPADVPVEAEVNPSMAHTGVAAADQPGAPLRNEPTKTLPEPVVFKRADFSFNRRFFETRLAGFFRLVPSEADKDMVVHIKSSRGDFTGRRITRITPAELYLQVFHDNATADEMIPFTEVMEVQVRHKDAA